MCFADICSLITNFSVDPKSANKYELLRRKYTAMCERVMSKETESSFGPVAQNYRRFFLSAAEVDPLFFCHLCSAYQCNAFGVFDPATDICHSLSMYPSASFFNRSCSPCQNLVRRQHNAGRFAVFYALRDIAAGESLTISYSAGNMVSRDTRRLAWFL